jgi:hypothetical protein
MNPSEKIDHEIKNLEGWCKPVMEDLRRIINEADPELKEEWKWNTPVWSKNGMVCSIGAFKNHVKFVVFKGSQIPDPDKLFNTESTGKFMRSIDFHEGDKMPEDGIKKLVQSAVKLNQK